MCMADNNHADLVYRLSARTNKEMDGCPNITFTKDEKKLLKVEN